MATRHRGYVAASDLTPTGTTWKVRVKDSTSNHDGRKLVVASVQDGIALAQGLNVDFIIGSIDGSKGEVLLRAVDVRITAL